MIDIYDSGIYEYLLKVLRNIRGAKLNEEVTLFVKVSGSVKHKLFRLKPI